MLRNSWTGLQQTIIAVSLLYVVGFIVMLVVQPGSDEFYAAFHNIYQILPPVFAGVCNIVFALRGPQGHNSQDRGWQAMGTLRGGWFLIGIGSLLWAAGQITWTYLETIRGVDVPSPGLTDIGYLGAYPFLLVGISLLFGSTPIVGRVRLLLDSAIAASAVGVLSWHFIMQYLWNDSEATLFAKIIWVAYPLGDIAVLFSALALFSGSAHNKSLRRSSAFLACGMILLAFADTTYNYYSLNELYKTGSWFDWSFSFGWLLIGYAALVSLWWPRRKNGADAATTQRFAIGAHRVSLLRVLLPYMAVAGAVLVVGAHDYRESGSLSNLTFIAGGWLILLVIARQVLTLTENQQLAIQLQSANADLKNFLATRTDELAVLQRHVEERQRAEEELDHFFTLSLDMLCIAGFDGYFKRLNPSWEQALGYSCEELMAKPFIDFVHPDDKALTIGEAQKLSSGAMTISFENRYQCKDGSYKWLLWNCAPWLGRELIYGAALDITGRKQAETELARAAAELEQANQVLQVEVAERKVAVEKLHRQTTMLQTILDSMSDGVIVADEHGNFLFHNPAAAQVLGPDLTQDEASRLPHQARLFMPDAVTPYPRAELPLARAIRGENVDSLEVVVRSPDAPQEKWASANARPLRDAQGALRGGVAVFRDITRRKQTEQEMRDVQNFLSSIVENIPNMIFVKDARELRFARFNKAGEELLGYARDDLLGKNDYDLFPPEEVEFFIAKDRAVLNAGQLLDIPEEPIHTRQGVRILHTKKIPILDEEGVPQYLLGISEDITERKKAEEEIQRQAQELARSNQELEQFAYVASHDLQEPLRMVSSYTQLLSRRYKGKLDADADEFIEFAVDGAKRMQTLIQDLLAYSRVGSRGNPFAPTDCEEVLDDALANLKMALAENDALVTHDALPTVLGDRTQLLQLLQNLIGNAIKFRKKNEPARVHLAAALQTNDGAGEWVFTVRDNGTGIDPRYFERIFLIFQRLHSREEYSGTGIGLAVCKKIVERHGGCIWVESQPDQGSSFYFTIPDRKVNAP